jgi:hypothetical protein
MSQDSSAEPAGPGTGAAKPVTEPPGGALDRVLNDEPADPDDEDEVAGANVDEQPED